MWHMHQPQNQPPPQEVVGINHGLNAVTTMAPAATRVDFDPEVILKFYCPISLDYIALHELPMIFDALDPYQSK